MQPVNAVGSIVTDGEILTPIKLVHPENALAPIDVTLGIATLNNLTQPSNNPFGIVVISGDREILSIPLPLSAEIPNDVIFDKSIVANNVQPENTLSLNIVTFGIVMVDNLVQS